MLKDEQLVKIMMQLVDHIEDLHEEVNTLKSERSGKSSLSIRKGDLKILKEEIESYWRM